MRRLAGVDQSPAFGGEPVGWMDRDVVDPRLEKARPVVRHDRVQPRDYVGPFVGDDAWTGVLAAEKRARKRVERFAIAGLLADDAIDFEPHEFGFRIKIHAATFRAVTARSHVEERSGNRG